MKINVFITEKKYLQENPRNNICFSMWKFLFPHAKQGFGQSILCIEISS